MWRCSIFLLSQKRCNKKQINHHKGVFSRAGVRFSELVSNGNVCKPQRNTTKKNKMQPTNPNTVYALGNKELQNTHLIVKSCLDQSIWWCLPVSPHCKYGREKTLNHPNNQKYLESVTTVCIFKKKTKIHITICIWLFIYIYIYNEGSLKGIPPSTYLRIIKYYSGIPWVQKEILSQQLLSFSGFLE